MKSKIIVLAASILGISLSQATVTVNFNAAFSGGVSSNLANKVGTVSNGLFWGILIDTTGNGILNQYNDISRALNTNVFLTNTSSVLTDDLVIFAGDLTSNTSAFSEGDFTTPGGNGGITGIAGINLTGGVTQGDAFRVLWFDGDKVGVLSDASFIIPADGSATDFDAPFVGIDPTRTAGNSYAGTSGTSTGAGITLVPEPSAALLGALGALGLLRRRRN